MRPQFANRKFAKVAFLTTFMAVAPHLRAASWSFPVTGNLLGTVVDTAGAPQIGASIKLFNKYDRVVAKTLSTSDGRFAFVGLAPEFYSLHVSLESFVPAFRDKIAIRAGANSMLQINMANLFSSIQLNSTVPVGAMTNDWKWVLRSSPATRPITRFLPVQEPVEGKDSVAALHPRLFSGTRMLVGISGGNAALVDSDLATSDIGTQFALSTNVYGKSGLQLAGRVGQNSETGPTAFAFGAIYSPSASYGFANSPEVALTVSQFRMAPANEETSEGTLMLRAMSLGVYETADPMEFIHVEYGVTGESVDYMQHSSRLSPFARITTGLGSLGDLKVAYSDGGRPDELTEHAVSKTSQPEELLDEDLSAPINALARIPQMSVRDGRLQLQRTQNFEAGLTKTLGNTSFSFSSFYENVSNGRINVAGDLTGLQSDNILSDGISKISTYNIGNYNRNGYLASIDRKFSDVLSLQVAYGRMGAFSARESLTPGINSKADFLSSRNHNIAGLGLRARVPKAGTCLFARYGWADPRASIPDHSFTTQNIAMAVGLNIGVRQPIPGFFGLGGRLELTGDLRNLLSQGYLPLNTADGGRMLIVQTPKAIRGGLSITF